MTKRLQQFYVFKIESDRLKESKYSIDGLTIEQARLNGELVAISDSQLIRTIYKVKKKPFSNLEIRDLNESKRRLAKKRNSAYNRNRLREISEKIDKLLFIPEIVSVKFVNKKHYSKILDIGFFSVNGKEYVPFMASSGMIRRNTAMFIQRDISEEVNMILSNGKSFELEISPAKYSAYFALYSSSSIQVTFPKMAIVPDLLIKTVRDVEYTQYQEDGIDPLVEQRNMELECNAFDGQGLVSPPMARRWSLDLELDYLPSAFIVRAPFLKGLCVTFDFHKFAKEIAGEDIITDIYGNRIDIYDIDVIISESQFKLWNAYSSAEEYYSNCVRNELGWGVSRVSPKEDKTHAMSSYQFLQVLDLDEKGIEELCKPTVDWFKQVSGGDVLSTLLYLMGDTDYGTGWFGKLDPILQAILLNNDVLKDFHILSHLDKNLSRKKKDAMMGRLIFSGNYSFAIADPYYQCCHIFKTAKEPLLKEGQHYSFYWNARNVKNVTAIRSPIVHHSEVNVLNLVDENSLDGWYKYISSGVVFPANGIGMDFAINGGMDVDGDLICTIDNPAFISGRVPGLPIVYDTQKAQKSVLSQSGEEVYRSVEKGFGTKVGFFTNVSTTFYSLLSEFSPDSIEAKTIHKRLKYGRTLQGLEIDKQKGLIVAPFPEHWTKWKKITEDMSLEERQKNHFHNSILADKRPYFMRWLYPHYNSRYTKERAAYENVSYTKWGMSLDELFSLEVKTTEQIEFLEKYKRRTFFIDNNSTMNRISRYMEEQIKKIKGINKKGSADFDFTVYTSETFSVPSGVNLDKMVLLYKHWKSLKKALNIKREVVDENYSDISQVNGHVNRMAYSSISSNAAELADMAVYLCYNVLGKTSRTFCWQVFGSEIVANMLSKYDKKYVLTPKKSDFGSQEYLWSRYGMYTISIEV